MRLDSLDTICVVRQQELQLAHRGREREKTRLLILIFYSNTRGKHNLVR